MDPSFQSKRPSMSGRCNASKMVSRTTSVRESTYDQGFYTGKIANVDAYRMLPAKLEPGELSSAQMTSKQAFGVGWTLAKRAREAKHLRIGSHSLGISKAKYNL
jgi:hypothetical protein